MGSSEGREFQAEGTAHAKVLGPGVLEEKRETRVGGAERMRGREGREKGSERRGTGSAGPCGPRGDLSFYPK